MPSVYRDPVTTPAALATDPAAGRGRPVVSLTTDFGARDPSAAICKGVVLTIAPAVTVIDITHEVAKFQVRDGALVLWCALPFLPVGVAVPGGDPGGGGGGEWMGGPWRASTGRSRASPRARWRPQSSTWTPSAT